MKLHRVAVALLAVGLLTQLAAAQVTQTELTLPAYYYYEWIVPAGDRPAFMPLQPVDLKWNTHALADGTYLCSFGTGAPQTIVMLGFRNGPEMPIVSRLVATVVGDGPVDPVDPDDPPPGPLTGIAKLAYESIPKIKPESRSLIPQVAANFRATAAAIAAGVVKETPAPDRFTNAINNIYKRNQAIWGSRGRADWLEWLYAIGFALDTADDAGKITDMKLYGRIYAEIAKGLEAHGR